MERPTNQRTYSRREILEAIGLIGGGAAIGWEGANLVNADIKDKNIVGAIAGVAIGIMTFLGTRAASIRAELHTISERSINDMAKQGRVYPTKTGSTIDNTL